MQQFIEGPLPSQQSTNRYPDKQQAYQKELINIPILKISAGVSQPSMNSDLLEEIKDNINNLESHRKHAESLGPYQNREYES